MRKFTVNSLDIHDITLSLEAVGYAVHQGGSGFDFPEIRLASQDKPLEHGALVSGQLYGGRVVGVTGIVYGTTTLSLNARRRALSAAIRIVKNNYISQQLLCKITSDDGLLLQFYAYAQKFKMDLETRNKAKFLLDLFAPDPYLYAQTAQAVTLGVGSGTITNYGDANSWPTLTFNGPLTNPILTNTDLTESFKLNATIGGGDYVTVDTQAKTIVFNGITNYMDKFDIDNTWLSWIPGVNHLTLAVDAGGGNVGIGFRDAYVGL
jgi:hypothetical protein